MEAAHAVSILPTYADALHFDPFKCRYEIPSINFVKVDDIDDEGDWMDVHRCRPPINVVAESTLIGPRINMHQVEPSSSRQIHVDEQLSATIGKITADEILPSQLSSRDAVNSAQLPKKAALPIMAADRMNLNVSKSHLKGLSRHLIDRGHDVISIKVTEEVLCVSRNGKTEKYEPSGVVSISSMKMNENKTEKENEDINKFTDETASMTILFEDAEGMLSSIKANTTYITSAVLPALSKQKMEIANLPLSKPEKFLPILRYSMIPSFQPFYFKARSKMKIVLPDSKIVVQIIFNPNFRSLFENMETFSVQASLSCFLFNKNSKVTLRPSDAFNENSKIITWVCSCVDIEKESSMQLEGSVEGKRLNQKFYFPAFFSKRI